MKIFKTISRNLEGNFIWILVILSSVICSLLYKDYLAGKKIFLFMDAAADTFQQFWPYLTFMGDAVRDGSIWKFWSFQIGIGMNTFCIGHFIFDVFNWLLMPLNSTQLAYGLIYINVLKIILAGVFFFLWVKKTGVREEAALVGGLLYAFNSYMILWGQFIFFATIVVYAPLLLYATERALRESKWLMFSVVTGLAAVASFYLFYILAIALSVYIVLRVVQENRKTPKKMLRLFTLFAVMALLGLGLFAVVLLPSIGSILSSPRVHANLWNIKWLEMHPLNYWISVLTRSFSDGGIFMSGKLLTGNLNWDGSLFESPHLYSGLMVCMIIPQLFFLSNKLVRNGLLGLGIAIMAFLIFPCFSFIFEGFNRIAFRWTFVYLLFILFIFTHVYNAVISHELRIRKGLWIASAVVAFIVYNVAWYWGKNHYSFSPKYILVFNGEMITIAVFMLLYCIWGLLWGRPKLQKYLLASLPLLIASELVISHNTAINHRYPIPSQTGYIEAREEYIRGLSTVIRDLQAGTPGFYRLESDFSFTWGPNDPFMIRNYNSTTSYLSFQQPAYIKLLKLFNADTPMSTLMVKGIPLDRVGLKSLLNIRYFLSASAQGGPEGFKLYRSYEQIAIPSLYEQDINLGDFNHSRKNHPIYVFENPNALPLGFLQTAYMSEKDFKPLAPLEKDRRALSAAVLKEPINKNWQLRKIRLEDMKPIKLSIAEITARLQAKAMKLENYKGNFIKGSLLVSSPSVLCFAIPFDAGWECDVNGKREQLSIVYGGLMGLYLEPGHYSITLHYTPPGLKKGLLLTILSFMVLILLIITKFPKTAN